VTIWYQKWDGFTGFSSLHDENGRKHATNDGAPVGRPRRKKRGRQEKAEVAAKALQDLLKNYINCHMEACL
jgi:hypothetical protein